MGVWRVIVALGLQLEARSPPGTLRQKFRRTLIAHSRGVPGWLLA